MEFGVRPGDQAVPYFEFTVMNNEKMLLAKAWDNRIGCAIAIDVLKGLKDADHPNVVYGVGTIQEEVGLAERALLLMPSSRTSDLEWMSGLQAILLESLTKKLQAKWGRASNHSL